MAYVALNKFVLVLMTGVCLLSILLYRPQQAIKCLRKGLAGGISKSPTDHERALHMKMATIFDSLGASADASECHRHVITISRRLGNCAYYATAPKFSPSLPRQTNYRLWTKLHAASSLSSLRSYGFFEAIEHCSGDSRRGASHRVVQILPRTFDC
jgi:hypothetical protein